MRVIIIFEISAVARIVVLERKSLRRDITIYALN